MQINSYGSEQLKRFHYLGLSDKDPVVLLAGEVAFALHGAVVLALGLVQDDAHPFPRGEEGGAHVGYSATLALPDDPHHGADLEQRQREWRVLP